MNNLRRLREARGLTQGKLAKLADIGQSQISKFERTLAMPRLLRTKENLARIFGCSIKAIFPDHVDEQPAKPVLFKSSVHENPTAAASEIRTCKWCGVHYRSANEVKIMMGDRVLKVYGHMGCLEQDVRTDGMAEWIVKKRGSPR